MSNIAYSRIFEGMLYLPTFFRIFFYNSKLAHFGEIFGPSNPAWGKVRHFRDSDQQQSDEKVQPVLNLCITSFYYSDDGGPGIMCRETGLTAHHFYG